MMKYQRPRVNDAKYKKPFRFVLVKKMETLIKRLKGQFYRLVFLEPPLTNKIQL